MREAAGRLCGHHDFRNLCKMDVGNGVVSYHRRLERVTITTLDGPSLDRGPRDGPAADRGSRDGPAADGGSRDGPAADGGDERRRGEDGGGYQMCQLEVRGNAFLWHQIRYGLSREPVARTGSVNCYGTQTQSNLFYSLANVTWGTDA